MARHARRTDENLTEIVKAYRRMGCVVHVTNGAWDLTVQFAGITDICEVKDGAKSPSRRKLTTAESKLHDKMMIRMVMGLNDVADHVGALRRKSLVLMGGMK